MDMKLRRYYLFTDSLWCYSEKGCDPVLIDQEQNVRHPQLPEGCVMANKYVLKQYITGPDIFLDINMALSLLTKSANGC